jgi:hypothetical protein
VHKAEVVRRLEGREDGSDHNPQPWQRYLLEKLLDGHGREIFENENGWVPNYNVIELDDLWDAGESREDPYLALEGGIAAALDQFDRNATIPLVDTRVDMRKVARSQQLAELETGNDRQLRWQGPVGCPGIGVPLVLDKSARHRTQSPKFNGFCYRTLENRAF